MISDPRFTEDAQAQALAGVVDVRLATFDARMTSLQARVDALQASMDARVTSLEAEIALLRQLLATLTPHGERPAIRIGHLRS